jgi:hypothetical protein
MDGLAGFMIFIIGSTVNTCDRVNERWVSGCHGGQFEEYGLVDCSAQAVSKPRVAGGKIRPGRWKKYVPTKR